VAFEAFTTGAVILYPYLWARQHDGGEREGRKSRPTAVGVRLSTASGDRLILLAITTRMPDAGRHAIEIPETEKRRAGLDIASRLLKKAGVWP
jgi:hypothetical protein